MGFIKQIIKKLFQTSTGKAFLLSLLWISMNVFFIEDSFNFIGDMQLFYFNKFGNIYGFFLNIMFTLFFLFPLLLVGFVRIIFLSISNNTNANLKPEAKLISLILSLLLSILTFSFFAILFKALFYLKLIFLSPSSSHITSLNEIIDLQKFFPDPSVVSSVLYYFFAIIPYAFAMVTVYVFSFAILIFQLFPLISAIILCPLVYYKFQARQKFIYLKKHK